MMVEEMEPGMRFPSRDAFDKAHVFVGKTTVPATGEILCVFFAPGFMGTNPRVYTALVSAMTEIPHQPLPDAYHRRMTELGRALNYIRKESR